MSRLSQPHWSALMLAPLLAAAACNLDWESLEPLPSDASGVGGTSDPTSAGGGTVASAGGSGAVGGGGAQGSGGGAGGADELVGDGLIVRYFIDEAESGTGPSQLIDAAPSPLTLTINYGMNLAYVASDGSRGWRFSEAGGDGDARAALAGTKILQRLQGATQATIEVVLAHEAATSPVSFINTFGDGAVHRGSFSLNVLSDGTELGLYWKRGTLLATWPGIAGQGRRVVHAVLDTTQASPDARVGLYVDGVARPPTTIGSLPAGESIDISTETTFVLGNGVTPNNAIEGVIHYFALYDEALEPAAVAQNAARLLESDDGP